MFNMLIEHFSVCQCLLKEQRRPPTGGLRWAKESLEGGVSTPLSPWLKSEMTYGVSVTGFPPPGENDWLLLGMDCPP